MARIVHITTVHPAFDIRIFQKQCRTLSSAGYEVTLIAPCDKKHPAGETARIEGIDIRFLPKAKNRLLRMLHTTRLALREALKLDADLYHLHDPELLPAAGRLRRAGRSVVFDMHENLPKDLLHKPWLPAAVRRPASAAASFAQRFLLARLPVVLAEDSYAADYAWLADTTVVRNMPLVEELLAVAEQESDSSRRSSYTPMVGYMGSISSARGSHVMLEALAVLREKGIDCGLELIGPTSDELRQKVKQLRLDNVQISGWLPPPQAWRRMARCQVGLALLSDQPNYRDSLPTKIFEYMALGLPVVVSDFPLYRQIVEPAGCGVCVDPSDPRAVAAALSRLLTDPDEAARMGRRGRQAVVDHYNWKKEAVHLLALYERLLGLAKA